MKDTLPRGGVLLGPVALSGPVTTGGTSGGAPAASAPAPAAPVGHGPVPEPAQGPVAALPEAGPRARVPVEPEPRSGGLGGPVRPARPALLPVARGERVVRSAVVGDHVPVAHVRRHRVRVLVRSPWRSPAGGPADATIPPPERRALLGFIVADLPVLQLLSGREAHHVHLVLAAAGCRLTGLKKPLHRSWFTGCRLTGAPLRRLARS